MENNTKTFFLGIGGIIILGASLWYFGGRNTLSVPSTTTLDPHGHNLAANPSLQSLNNLVDKPAPAFSLVDRSGKVYSLNSLRGKNVILFFNEGLMCYPACWNQIVSLATDIRFKNDAVVTLSVVVDPSEDWQKAINKMPELAEATVVFDSDSAVSKKFGVLAAPSSMHPGMFPGHTYVVIDKEGIVRYVLDDPNMGIRNDQIMTEMEKLK